MGSQYLNRLYDQDKLLFLKLFKLLAQTIEVDRCLVDHYILGDDALVEEGTHLAGECIQEVIVSVMDTAVNSDEVRLHSLLFLLKVLRQPMDVAFLATVGWTHHHEAIPH